MPGVAERAVTPLFGGGRIKHVVVIVQENRTVDNLFNGFPGADTVTYGKNRKGRVITLRPTSLRAPYDISHRHKAWVNEYDGGKMDGFSVINEKCYRRRCPPRQVAAYGYVPEQEVQPYWDMASSYTFADNMFQTNQGPSFPAHQYILSGTSTIAQSSSFKASENASDPQHVGHQGGCDSLQSTTVLTIDPSGKEGQPVYPCFDRESILNLMNGSNVSWSYYQAFGGSGAWHAADAIRSIWESKSYSNVRWPSHRVLKDIAAGELASVVFVTPTANASDHAGTNNGSGPSWVSAVVNAIGESSYWQDTAIIVTWDDWGGWFDHRAPRLFNSFELGFRVPLIVISPYAKRGHVSKTHYEFGSILKTIEETFGLGSLGTTDVRSNDLADCFNFGARPRAFRPIAAPLSARYFESLPLDDQSPDDDF